MDVERIDDELSMIIDGFDFDRFVIDDFLDRSGIFSSSSKFFRQKKIKNKKNIFKRNFPGKKFSKKLFFNYHYHHHNPIYYLQ